MRGSSPIALSFFLSLIFALPSGLYGGTIDEMNNVSLLLEYADHYYETDNYSGLTKVFQRLELLGHNVSGRYILLKGYGYLNTGAYQQADLYLSRYGAQVHWPDDNFRLVTEWLMRIHKNRREELITAVLPPSWRTHPVPLNGKQRTEQGIAFSYIPPGTFSMGCIDGEEHTQERPVHTVNITKGFWMGRFEVTQQQWNRVMDTNPSRFIGGTRPVDSVSWNDCQAYIRKLNQNTKSGRFSLPTEAQWEYACRAGNPALRYGELEKIAFYHSHGTTYHVGLKMPNSRGLYDTLGNVSEWCADWYGDTYYEKSPSADPMGPETGTARIHRGGNFYTDYEYCTAAFRSADYPENSSETRGFRLVYTP